MNRGIFLIPFLLPMVMVGQQSTDLSTMLRQKDQALADAIAPGKRKIWDDVMSPDFFYADENNHVMDRQEFLKEFLPLPNGASGHISVGDYQVHRMGDTALVVHRDDETESYFGSELHAQYLMTETWQLVQGQWKLRAVHCAAVPIDPPAATLTDEQIDQLTGTFRAGTLSYVIRREGQRVFGGQPGHKETELKAETRDVLFIPGQPRSHKVFARDPQGKVTGFADRRENRDLTWSKVSTPEGS